jgi:hypothetical protein
MGRALAVGVRDPEARRVRRLDVHRPENSVGAPE